MKNELLWLDERIKESLLLLPKEQEDSVFFYIHQMQSQLRAQRRFPVILSFDESDGGTAPPMTEEVEEAEEMDLDFDLDLDFNFDSEEDHLATNLTLQNEVPLMLREDIEDPIFNVKSTIVFTDTGGLRFEFLSGQLPSLTALPLFSSEFSIKDWILNYEGKLYFTHSEQPSLYGLGEGGRVRISKENFTTFENNNYGAVLFTLPDPVLMLNDWCIRLYSSRQTEAANEVLLMNYPIKREIYQYIRECIETKVMFISAAEHREQAAFRMKDIGPFYFFEEVQIRTLASILLDFSTTKLDHSLDDDVFFIPVWKTEANIWLHQDKKDEQMLEQIFTKNLVDMFNDWFISAEPSNSRILGTLLRCVRIYEDNKDKMKKQMHKLKKESSIKEKNAAYITIDSYFHLIKKELVGGLEHG